MSKKSIPDEASEKRRQELLAKLDGFKENNDNLSEEDLKEILASLDEIISIENKSTPLIKKIGDYLFHLSLKYIVMFICITLIGSLFMSHIVIDRNIIFIAIAIVAIPLTIINAPHLFGVNIIDTSLLKRIFMAIGLLIIVMCLANAYLFTIFKFNLDWVFLLVLGEILFIIVDYFLATRVPFY